MKGLVFNLLENQILADHGEHAWERILRDAGVDDAYQTHADYPAEDLLLLLDAAEPYTRRGGREAQRWFGRRAFHQLAAEFHHLFKPHDSTVAFARAINDTIHPEVRKHYPGAEVPTFDVEEHPPGGDLRLRYESYRGLCSFAEGLIEGVGNLYGEKVTIQQPRCVHEKDPHCDLVITAQGDADKDPFGTLDLHAPPRARRSPERPPPERRHR